MNWIAENALTIWVVGAIALAIAAAVYWETRQPKALAAVGVVILVTAALLITERLIETPREAVARTLQELAAAVQANDVDGTLRHISPTAGKMRTDVQKMMPQAQIDMAHIIAGPLIEFNDDSQPTKAVAKIRGAVRGKVKNTSMQGTVLDDLTVEMVYDGQHWLIESYSSERDWTRELRR